MQKIFGLGFGLAILIGCAASAAEGQLSQTQINNLNQRYQEEHDSRQNAERERAVLQRDLDQATHITQEMIATRVAAALAAHPTTPTPASQPPQQPQPPSAPAANGGGVASQPPQQAAHAPNVTQTSVPPCDVDGMGVPVPGGINETQGFYDGPAPYAGASPAGGYVASTINNFPYAVSFTVNGRIQHQFAGGTFPSEATVRTATGGICRMPVIPPGNHDIGFLFDHVGRQNVQAICYRYVSGRVSEAFGGFSLHPRVPYDTRATLMPEACQPLPGTY